MPNDTEKLTGSREISAKHLTFSVRKYPCHIDFFEKCAYNLIYEVTSQDEFVRKVGENMADKEIIEKLADECGGIFRTSDSILRLTIAPMVPPQK